MRVFLLKHYREAVMGPKGAPYNSLGLRRRRYPRIEVKLRSTPQ